MEESKNIDPTGHHVVITSGEHAGCEGVCLGHGNRDKWAVSLDNTSLIVDLEFEREFRLLPGGAGTAAN